MLHPREQSVQSVRYFLLDHGNSIQQLALVILFTSNP